LDLLLLTEMRAQGRQLGEQAVSHIHPSFAAAEGVFPNETAHNTRSENQPSILLQ
jgi:hypothetical protein